MIISEQQLLLLILVLQDSLKFEDDSKMFCLVAQTRLSLLSEIVAQQEDTKLEIFDQIEGGDSGKV